MWYIWGIVCGGSYHKEQYYWVTVLLYWVAVQILILPRLSVKRFIPTCYCAGYCSSDNPLSVRLDHMTLEALRDLYNVGMP